MNKSKNLKISKYFEIKIVAINYRLKKIKTQSEFNNKKKLWHLTLKNFV